MKDTIIWLSERGSQIGIQIKHKNKMYSGYINEDEK